MGGTKRLQTSSNIGNTIYISSLLSLPFLTSSSASVFGLKVFTQDRKIDSTNWGLVIRSVSGGKDASN